MPKTQLHILLEGLDQCIASAAGNLTEARQSEPVRFALGSVETASALLAELHLLLDPAPESSPEPPTEPKP